jgi:cytochrome c-type biogenesis protein CcmH
MLLPLLTVVALATLALVCLPLLRGSGEVADRGRFDRAVYRDQLREIDRDLTRGVLSVAEAESARLEIQRRLLAAGADACGGTVRASRDPKLAIGVGVLLVCGAAGLYVQLGSPSLPDVPFARRAGGGTGDAAGHVDIKDAAIRLAEKLKSDPNSLQGWLLYARTESLLDDWQQAAGAYRRAIDLGADAPDVFAAFGETQVLAAGGIVPPAARDAFAKALAADPKNDVARYYTALADSQAGNVRRAIDAWLALAVDIPEDAPMRQAIARGIADAAKAGGTEAPALPKGAPPSPGPSDDQMAEAAKLPPARRDEMIRGMVAQFAATLRDHPDDVEGWLRLGRSYSVLGENDNAVDAYQHATGLRPDDIDIKLLTFDAMVAGLQPNDPVPARALALLQQIAAARPDQPQVLWFLGLDAARAGRSDDARRNWTKLLAGLPAGSEGANLVRRAIDALGRDGPPQEPHQ